MSCRHPVLLASSRARARITPDTFDLPRFREKIPCGFTTFDLPYDESDHPYDNCYPFRFPSLPVASIVVDPFFGLSRIMSIF
ncbi:hypothetical protein M422DRAFT_36494 [Sphaerobolus stellatus SS14]|uniref:Uncharacterized protein n=1 Tax=Sphaerobolus stellatus (strain SS14) TaxID=990650 RepID=A0A0C9UNW5_SPHS4|nr:hypothetical protein M422DRAFT_36494 [Sphaerobolus stellatus SS14]